MAALYLPVLIIFTCVICVQAKYLTGKAYYCRDPDTGKLHEVNSTWPSTSFCGNYTCKLKKRNISETETAIRQINISIDNVEISTKPTDVPEVVETPKTSDMSESPSVIIETRVEPDIQPLFHKAKFDVTNKNKQIELEANNLDKGDRYLTESEIKTITEILHTVKKSDLDAIVEIYNLAQEIYQEIDKTDTVDDKFKSIKDNSITRDSKQVSYWYEPLHLGHKYKPTDTEKQSSNLVPESEALENPQYFHRMHNNYLNQVPNDPFSEFQTMSSYINPHDIHKKKHCKNNIKKVETKIIQPSVLLPYPYSYTPHYNSSYPPNLFPNEYPWSWNVYKKAYQPYLNAYIARLPSNAILINPYRLISKDVELIPLVKEEINNLQRKEMTTTDWQTEPLPPNVLEEIKANIDKKIKSSSLRKMVNLEKVGKVIKLDEFSRSKRDVGDNADEDLGGDHEDSEYDVVLEKTTCQSEADTRPGFFRVGHLDEPYPSCCPQRIEN